MQYQECHTNAHNAVGHCERYFTEVKHIPSVIQKRKGVLKPLSLSTYI